MVKKAPLKVGKSKGDPLRNDSFSGSLGLPRWRPCQIPNPGAALNSQNHDPGESWPEPGIGGGFDSSHRPVVGKFDRFNGFRSNILLTFSYYFDNPQMSWGGHLNRNSQLWSNAPPMPGLPPQQLNNDRCISRSVLFLISNSGHQKESAFEVRSGPVRVFRCIVGPGVLKRQHIKVAVRSHMVF